MFLLPQIATWIWFGNDDYHTCNHIKYYNRNYMSSYGKDKSHVYKGRSRTFKIVIGLYVLFPALVAVMSCHWFC